MSDQMEATRAEESADGKISCRVCGARTHLILAHLKDAHPELTEAEYVNAHPGAPMMSPVALRKLAERRSAIAMLATPALEVEDPMHVMSDRGFMHEVFDLGSAKAAMSASTGKPIPTSTFKTGPGLSHFVPEKDPGYVFDINVLKIGLMALERGYNALFWGHAGTGKSSIWKQIAAHSGRPTIRIQHTRNTEESHIIGEKTVENGSVRFVLGPLAFAMKFGLLYVADEYDFAMPSVLSVYQPIMEGEPLIIKEADEANRIIRPHANFRFVATGNTNGTGDDTGLYQGTLLQNSANYERFHVVKEVKYMDKKLEAQIIKSQGRVPQEVAEKLVNFATQAREAYGNGKLGSPPSPRAMINAAKIGSDLGDRAEGIRFAYINRLSRIDAEAANEVLRRISF